MARLIRVEQGEETVFEVEEPVITIGRGSANHVPVADNAANTCTICHLASTNTFGYDHMDGTDNVRSGSIGTRTGC